MTCKISLGDLIAKVQDSILADEAVSSVEVIVPISQRSLWPVHITPEVQRSVSHNDNRTEQVDLLDCLLKLYKEIGAVKKKRETPPEPKPKPKPDHLPQKLILHYPDSPDFTLSQYPPLSVYNTPEGGLHIPKVVECIGEALIEFSQEATRESLFTLILKKILGATESEYGFIGRIDYSESGDITLHSYSISNIWDGAAPGKKIPGGENFLTGLIFSNLNSLFGFTMRTHEFCISNDPATDPRSRQGGIPKHHPPLNYYLGCPLFAAVETNGERKMIGMVGIANRKGGYSVQTIRDILPVLYACSGILIRYEAMKENEQLHGKLHQTNLELEEKVVHRTKELLQKNDILHEEIEQRKKLESQLAKTNKNQNEFFSTISHELRSPIQSIVGICDLLMVHTQLEEFQKQKLASIAENGTQLINLVSDVLDIGKLEAGKLTFATSHFSIVEAIVETSRCYGHVAYGKGLKFSYTIDPKLFHYTVLGDKKRFTQIIVNLYCNAVKFTEKGAIAIHCKFISLKESELCFNVDICDTGKGIPKDQMEKLFNIFYQTNSAMASSHVGTGIGLFLCKSLVEEMNGSIRVSSEVARGSTFSVALRLICAPITKFQSLFPFFDCKKNKPTHHILILDPSEETQKCLALIINCVTQLPKENIPVLKAFPGADLRKYAAVFVNEALSKDLLLAFQKQPVDLQEEWKKKIIFLCKLPPTDPLLCLFSRVYQPISVENIISALHEALDFTYVAPKTSPTTPRLKPIFSRQFPARSRVLIVDDSGTTRLVFKKLCQRNDWIVEAVSSGSAALERQQATEFDLVFMDVSMVPMSGIQCVKKWRNYEQIHAIEPTFIVACTGHGSEQDIANSLSAGMDYHFTKPIRLQHLQQMKGA